MYNMCILVLYTYTLECKLLECMCIDVCMNYIKCVHSKTMHSSRSSPNFIVCMCLLSIIFCFDVICIYASMHVPTYLIT